MQLCEMRYSTGQRACYKVAKWLIFYRDKPQQDHLCTACLTSLMNEREFEARVRLIEGLRYRQGRGQDVVAKRVGELLQAAYRAKL